MSDIVPYRGMNDVGYLLINNQSIKSFNDLEFKHKVLAAWDNNSGESKIDIASRFDIEPKAIDHFISQRRRGKI